MLKSLSIQTDGASQPFLPGPAGRGLPQGDPASGEVRGVRRALIKGELRIRIHPVPNGRKTLVADKRSFCDFSIVAANFSRIAVERSTRCKPRSLSWRSGRSILPQPKTRSITLRLSWLMRRRLSIFSLAVRMFLAKLPFSYSAMCGATLRCRTLLPADNHGVIPTSTDTLYTLGWVDVY